MPGKRRKEGIPRRRFRGLCVYLETDIFAEYYSDAITELEIDMDKIRDLAVRKPRYYVLHHQEGLDRILQGMAEGFDRKYQPILKIKTLELLLYLSSPALTEEGETAVYLNKNQVWIAETVQKLLTEDLSRRLTIEQLAEMLDVGTTTLKHSFKMVYGCSIYQYHKVIRLDEAQRLLRETTLSVNEIAARVGYMNPAKLSTAFKTKYGIQPSVYRKNR